MNNQKIYSEKEVAEIIKLVNDIKDNEPVLRAELRMDGDIGKSMANDYLTLIKTYREKIPKDAKNIKVVDSKLEIQCEYYANK